MKRTIEKIGLLFLVAVVMLTAVYAHVSAAEPAKTESVVEEMPAEQTEMSEIGSGETVAPEAATDEIAEQNPAEDPTTEAEDESNGKPDEKPEEDTALEELPVESAVPSPAPQKKAEEEKAGDEKKEEKTEKKTEDKAEEKEDEKQEDKTGEELATALEIANALVEIVEASEQMDQANRESIEDLQEYIEETKKNYDGLSEDIKATLSEGIGQLENVSVAVDTMQDSIVQLEETGSIQIEETGLPNSWRYVNGVAISDVKESVVKEAEDVAEMVRLGKVEEQPVINVLTADNKVKQGADISFWNWDEPIDWAKVRKDLDFIIIRCGYGRNYTSQDDKRWAESVAACEKYGIPYGTYLYSYATTMDDVDQEVAHVLRLLKGHKPAYPVFFDVEENSQGLLGEDMLSRMCERFCSKVRNAGYKAGVYSSTSWWEAYLEPFSKKSGYYHWVAHWAPKCTYSGRIDMWQYTSEGTVNGISGNVDRNYWYAGDVGPSGPGGGGSDGKKERKRTVANGIYEIVSMLNSNYCIDVAGGSGAPGANIQLWSRNGTVAQKFYVEYAGFEDVYTITSVYSGNALDVYNNGTANGTNIHQWGKNNTNAQRFRIESAGNGTYRLVAYLSDKFVQVAGAKVARGSNIQIGTISNAKARTWKFSPTSVAELQPAAGTYEIVSAMNQDYCMDVSNGSSARGANIQLWQRNGSSAQKFVLKSAGGGKYQIYNAANGMYLDVANAGKANGTNVQQWNGNGSDAQKFTLVPLGNGQYEIRSVLSGRVLEVKGDRATRGANIHIYDSSNAPRRAWILKPVAASGLPDTGTYEVRSALNENFCLDVAGGSGQKGANIQLWNRNGSAAQRFYFRSVGNGLYRITNVNSWQSMDIDHASTFSGANVQQWTSNGTDAQLFRLIPVRNGRYMIQAVISNKVLSVSKGKAERGANVFVLPNASALAQMWVLNRVS